MHNIKKLTLFRKFLLFAFLFCFLFTALYFYCKSQVLKWLDEKNFIAEKTSISFVWEGLTPGLKITQLEIKDKNPNANLSQITADSIIIKSSIFSFIKLFSSFSLEFELKGLRLNPHGKISGEIVNGKGRIAYAEGMYHLINFSIKPLKFELPPEYSTLENEKLRKNSTYYTINFVQLDGGYDQNNREFSFNLMAPDDQVVPKKNYTIQAKGKGIFIENKLKEKNYIPMRGNVKINIENLSNFLDDLHESQFISGVINNLGAALGYPITKQKLSSNEIQEIMTNAVSFNLKFAPTAVQIGLLTIYP